MGASTIAAPKRPRWPIIIAIIAIIVIVAGVLAYVYLLPKTQPVSISETGSSLLYPLFHNYWVPNYTATHSNIQISTASTGSGTGISQATSGAVQIGGSDAYLIGSQVQTGLLNIPLAISAQQVNYNLPGLNNVHLNLTGTILAGIYNGTITRWNDTSIKSINPDTTLPTNVIIPIKRSDSSGDTFLFTSYLSKTTASWNTNCGFSTAVMPAKSTCTLNANILAANGNSGMVSTCQQNSYSIAYVGISFLATSTSDGLGYAYLQNQVPGNFVDITQANIQAAANALASQTPANETISLILAPGTNSYPIINYEYAIVKVHQSSQAYATAVSQFLSWCINPQQGNSASYLNQVRFVALPSAIETLSQNQINQITYP